MGGADEGAEQDPKAAKKVAKAQAKLEKKLAKKRPDGAGEEARLSPTQARSSEPHGPTPAERSAAAAEHQVRLHRYRMLISLAAAVIALVTFLATVRPWRYLDALAPQRETLPVPSERVSVNHGKRITSCTCARDGDRWAG